MGVLDDIRATVGAVMPDGIGMPTGSLIRETGGVYNPITGRTTLPAVSQWTFRGLVLQYSDFSKLNTLIEDGDEKVLIIQTTLATKPQVGDRIRLKGRMYNVVRFEADPADATWIIQAR